MLQSTYERLTDTGPYQIDGASIGRRALRNTCLAYLAADGSADGIALAKAQFDAGQNMTDVLAALAVLCGDRLPGTRARRWQRSTRAWHGDDLVLDKWFAIQAMSPLPGTPEAVRTLAKHRGLRPAQPEPRARAGRQLCRRQSGAVPRCLRRAVIGFLADTIIALDPMNSQVAARLVPPLGQWRRVDAGAPGADAAGAAADPRCAEPQQGYVRDGNAQHRLSTGSRSNQLAAQTGLTRRAWTARDGQ